MSEMNGIDMTSPAAEKIVATDVGHHFLQDISLFRYIGQSKSVEMLTMTLDQYCNDLLMERNPCFQGILLVGPQGSGRRTLAHALANTMNCQIYEADGLTMSMGGQDVSAFLEQGDRDQIHIIIRAEKLSPYCCQILIKALVENTLVKNEYGEEKILQEPYYPFIILLAEQTRLVNPILRREMDVMCELGKYTYDEISQIISQRLSYLNWQVESDSVIQAIVQVSCGWADRAVKLLDWSYRVCRSKDEEVITEKHLNQALHLLG